jgi:hypothetical protein
VITEILLAPLARDRISDSTLKVVITYLYVDVKEPARPWRSAVGLASGISSFRLNSKRSLFASFVAALVPCLHPSTHSSLVVGVAGVEPATLRLSSACSNQLSYTPLFRGGLGACDALVALVEAWGFEPQTYSLQSYRSTN